MDLSICVLTHNQPDLLAKCVAACFAEIEKAGIAGDVIVIDNASNDGGPQRVAAAYPAVRLLRNEENLSFSAANNRGILASTGRFVMILNDDAILQEGSLGLMLRELESRPDVGAVGPMLLNPDGSLQRHFTNRRFPHLLNCLALVLQVERQLEGHAWTRRVFGLDRDLGCSGESEHLAGACLMVRREALDAVGLFDEGFTFWFEDTDLCCRLKEAGWKPIYLAEAQVTHWGSATTATGEYCGSKGRIGKTESTVLFFKSQTYYLRKHWSAPKYLFGRLACVPAFFVEIALVLLKLRIRGLRRKERTAWVRTYLTAARVLLMDGD